MSNPHLISVKELGDSLGAPGVKILDASWYLPADNRNPRSDYLAGHIPGAGFFDIAAIADRSSPLPNTLAPEADFTLAVRRLGINAGDAIVVYDTAGLFSAARAWWNFRLAGVKSVRVLDGGFPAWLESGQPTEAGERTSAEGNFVARYNLSLLRTFDEVLAIVKSAGATIVDARGASRFSGAIAETRTGLSSGHISGSANVHYASLLDERGRFKPEAKLRSIFSEAGVDLAKPIIASCGSGVTAGILALALAGLGRPDIPIYDGSWTEWGSRAESAAFIATGSS